VLGDPQFLHDLVHDPTIQLRPIRHQTQTPKKYRVKVKYWSAIEYELQSIFRRPFALQDEIYTPSTPHLRTLFSELRAILISFSSNADLQLIREVVDPELITQQIEHGVFNMDGFADFLGALLKRHCAPRRDKAVDQMTSDLQICFRKNETMMAKALEALFELLEVMKLVGN